MVPMDHRSALASYWRDMMTSGAMYIGDPHKVAAITPSCKNLAKPKSAEKETIIGINRHIFNLKEFTNLIKEIK